MRLFHVTLLLTISLLQKTDHFVVCFFTSLSKNAEAMGAEGWVSMKGSGRLCGQFLRLPETAPLPWGHPRKYSITT